MPFSHGNKGDNKQSTAQEGGMWGGCRKGGSCDRELLLSHLELRSFSTLRGVPEIYCDIEQAHFKQILALRELVYCRSTSTGKAVSVVSRLTRPLIIQFLAIRIALIPL